MYLTERLEADTDYLTFTLRKTLIVFPKYWHVQVCGLFLFNLVEWTLRLTVSLLMSVL